MSNVVQSFALVALETHVTESSAVRPGTEGLLVDRVCALDVTGGHELGVVVGTGPLWHPRPGACAYRGSDGLKK